MLSALLFDTNYSVRDYINNNWIMTSWFFTIVDITSLESGTEWKWLKLQSVTHCNIISSYVLNGHPHGLWRVCTTHGIKMRWFVTIIVSPGGSSLFIIGVGTSAMSSLFIRPELIATGVPFCVVMSFIGMTLINCLSVFILYLMIKERKIIIAINKITIPIMMLRKMTCVLLVLLIVPSIRDS